MATFTLRRKVHAKRRYHELVQEEVRKGLEEFSGIVVGKFEDTVDKWKEKPVFKAKTTVTQRRWVVVVSASRSTKAGKIFGWVDKGTGSRGGGQDYTIRPKKAKYLTFNVPHHPVTFPNPSIQGFPPTGDAKTIRAEVIIHPGIYPRNFTKTITLWAKSKEAGAFRSIIEARVKRAYRKIVKGETS